MSRPSEAGRHDWTGARETGRPFACAGPIRRCGRALQWWVSLDAVLVLSGAVLTSFVGVNGLVQRMALDRCLPQFLLRVHDKGTATHDRFTQRLAADQ